MADGLSARVWRLAWLLLLFFLYSVDCFKGSGIFKLPDLNVETNSTYLLRGVNTQLECRVHDPTGEWMNTTLDRVYWMKDGTPVTELKTEHTEFVESKGILTITRAAHSTEGEFQCSAIVRNIQLAAETVVDSRLVSAPVKLRRARITKFERYVSEAIRVKAGEVARIPCFGLPDVVPGPPEVWFEKQGHEGVQLGRTGQSTLHRHSDRTSDRVDPSGGCWTLLLHGKKFVHEHHSRSSETDCSEASRLSTTWSPGQTAVLECVIADSVVRWNKPDFSMPDVSIDNDRARIRQVWGNLRIKQVTVDDSDYYVCHGLKEYNDLRGDDHPKVIYHLIVHAPTNVRLMLAQIPEDSSWELSCVAHNLWYEIPMVYVNGLALIDVMDEMGVLPQTNFYTNPINATLKASNPLSGSVQGPLNATRSLGTRIQLICVPLGVDGLSARWLKDGKPLEISGNRRLRMVGSASLEIVGVRDEDAGNYTCEVSDLSSGFRSEATGELTVATQGHAQLPIPQPTNPAEDTTDFVQFELSKPTVFMDSEQNARVQWTVKASHEKHAYLREFIVEFRQKDPMRDNSSTLWTETDQRLPAHIRATTLRSLNPLLQYQFRVAALFTGGFAEIYSAPTEWLGFVEPKLTTPFAPRITRLQTISHSSILVGWDHTAGSRFNSPDSFVVRCEDTDTEAVREIRVENVTRRASRLRAECGGRVRVHHRCGERGRSIKSESTEDRPHLRWTILGIQGTIFLAFVTLLSAAIPLVCVLAFMVLRKYYASRSSLAIQPGDRHHQHHLNGPKDDLFRKNTVYQDPLFLNGDPLNELAPLNYAMDDRNDPMDLAPSIYGDKPFASIRGSGRGDFHQGSQMSLNNPSIGFRGMRHKPTDATMYGASGLNMSGIFHHLTGHEDERMPLTSDPHATSTLTRPGRSPSVSRSALCVFTGINGRPQVQRRHPLTAGLSGGTGMSAMSSPAGEGELPTTATTTTSPNGSANSPQSGHQHLHHLPPMPHFQSPSFQLPPAHPPPPLPERTYGMRAATSSVELSSSFRPPNSGNGPPPLRTFAADPPGGGASSALSQSQLHTGRAF
ncbi:Hemicentin-1 [Aphelenchoides fujianensis]|nr:Hemicentin-1 [Aphelenchoides fujianensis]